jgi:hypothetical protein
MGVCEQFAGCAIMRAEKTRLETQKLIKGAPPHLFEVLKYLSVFTSSGCAGSLTSPQDS